MKFLDISEVSERSGFSTSTLRYYEERGLIRSTGRHGLRRQYAPAILQQLSLIALGRDAGFSLEEMADLLPIKGRTGIDRRRLAGKADELDQTVQRLKAMRDLLRHVAHCPVSNQLECPTFQQLLRVSEKRNTDRSKKNKVMGRNNRE